MGWNLAYRPIGAGGVQGLVLPSVPTLIARRSSFELLEEGAGWEVMGGLAGGAEGAGSEGCGTCST